MHTYRTHTCGALTPAHIGQTVKLSGWIHRKRDHGGVLFIDLRDHYGLTQIVVNADSPFLDTLERLRVESVITVTGPVLARPSDTVNERMATGAIEVAVQDVAVQSSADQVPLQVNGMDDAGEDIRLKYRYLDLRREKMQKNIMLRTKVMRSLRNRMVDQGFNEFQTPIITASSPEGARDYVVPSRLHPGKFYALPQAPQQFKQLLMVGGFDRYFQIAPCFRDEDGRADRVAEFYQLDVEMSFVTQEDVFATMEPVIGGLFEEFSDFQGVKCDVTQGAWPRITHHEAMLKYGSDKPDLRNPLVVVDVTDIFKRDDVTFNAFKSVIDKGGIVRAIRAPNVADRPRSFFDKLNDWARGEGAPGLGYILFEGKNTLKGPIAKFMEGGAGQALCQAMDIQGDDAVFFVCDLPEKAVKLVGKARNKICDEIGNLREENAFRLLWVVDFPFFKEEDGKVDFEHNPFTSPQGGLEALETMKPTDVLAMQYDAVCNGYELCSGGIRNHRPDVMEKAMAIVGYDRDALEKNFPALYNAFRFGPPPHGGCAFGIDRMIMLIANEPNLREVNAFVMNGNYEDPMMNAPSVLSNQQMQDLHLRVALPLKKEPKAANG